MIQSVDLSQSSFMGGGGGGVGAKCSCIVPGNVGVGKPPVDNYDLKTDDIVVDPLATSLS